MRGREEEREDGGRKTEKMRRKEKRGTREKINGKEREGEKWKWKWKTF